MLSEKIKPNLEPSNLINSIPYFKSKYSDLCGLDDIFLKNQLHMAENNNEIIKMARGEGRKEILESIIEPCNLIFDWGQKSMHSLLDSSEIRKFLEPDGIDKELMFDLLELSEESLLYHTNKYNKKSCGIKSVIDKINKAILRAESQSDLIIIKEWLCYMLHTAGHNEFKKISPWVSVSTGKKRYNVAYMFGYRYKKAFVLYDYWEPKYEENRTFRNTNYVGNKLRSMGIDWHHNKNNEIMVKYALFPQHLVGYYYFEYNKLKYYCINHHYLKEWKKNKNFKIGDELYICQELVKFPCTNPYKMIYGRRLGSFCIEERR